MDIKELMNRYNFKSSRGVRAFITRHIEEINADGVDHARQTSEGWQFDDTAVRIIDKLRGMNEVAIVEREESEQVQELKEEVDNLKSLLLMTQNKLLQKQEELSQAEKKYLTAENTSKDYQSDLKVEELKRKHLEEKLSAAESQVKNLQSELDKLKKRGLVGRIFNNL